MLLALDGPRLKPGIKPPLPIRASTAFRFRDPSPLRSSKGNGSSTWKTAYGSITRRRPLRACAASIPDRRFIVLYDSVRVVDSTAVMLSDRENTTAMEARSSSTAGCGSPTGVGGLAATGGVQSHDAIALLTGEVRLADSTRTMYADTIYYDRDRETADAVGRVVLVDAAEDYSIAGAHGRYDR